MLSSIPAGSCDFLTSKREETTIVTREAAGSANQIDFVPNISGRIRMDNTGMIKDSRNARIADIVPF